MQQNGYSQIFKAMTLQPFPLEPIDKLNSLASAYKHEFNKENGTCHC